MVDTRFPTWKEAIPNKSIQAVWFPWCSILEGQTDVFMCIHLYIYTRIHIHIVYIYIYVFFCSTHRSRKKYIYIYQISYIYLYISREGTSHATCHKSYHPMSHLKYHMSQIKETYDILSHITYLRPYIIINKSNFQFNSLGLVKKTPWTPNLTTVNP